MEKYIIMSYTHMNYTPVSGNYPLSNQDPSLQSQQGTPLLKSINVDFVIMQVIDHAMSEDMLE